MNHQVKPASLLLLAILLAGCSTLVETSPPVHILQPIWGEHLDAGRSYHLRAEIRSTYPIAYVEICLWRVKENYEVVWRIDNPSQSARLSLDTPLRIPSEAPADDDYRLDVTAYPVKTIARYMFAPPGYSVKMAVDKPQ